MELRVSTSSSRRALKRRPTLGDITNVVAPASSTEVASVEHRSSQSRRETKPALRAAPGETSVRFETSVIGSCNCANPESREGVPSTSAAQVVETSANSVVDQHNPEPSKVYNLRSVTKQKGKWKADVDVLQLSCPPVERIRSMGNNAKAGHEDVDCHGTRSVPYPKPKKKWHYAMSKDVDKRQLTLPLEFVEKQKAYFAEIDAFELPEEEVSESQLE